ncbi:MAG: cysteine--tRNA ligase [Phycisphaerae bacterium]|jgi:cysteinyl-tRNA synthetase
MPLFVYNTLTRQREEFRPLNPPRVGMYVCGPTVYGPAHLGHAKSYISFDVVLRWLRFSGYDVNYVQNITDVGHMTDNDEDAGVDKLVLEARRRGLHPMAVAEGFTRSYQDDMDALSVLRPDIAPRATGHIPEQIELTRALIERGHAYESNGSVYFDVTSFRDYGKLSGRLTEDLEAGARVAVNAEKRNPADFALWKRAEPEHIMRWSSPWGEGFPGWHLECSAMSQKYLGDTLDIHGGGIENQFPHHECEIAQSECATGRPFVRYWLHNNMVTLNGIKMGKSLGNAISLADVFYTPRPLCDRAGNVLLERAFAPAVVRHFILTSHYRQPLDFSQAALEAAESGTLKLRDALRELARAASAGAPQPDSLAQPSRDGARTSSWGGGAASDAWRAEGQATPLAALRATSESVSSAPVREVLIETVDRFTAALNDDFNTAVALASLFDLGRRSAGWVAADSGVPPLALAAASAVLARLADDVLGLRWDAPGSTGMDPAAAARQDGLIGLLVEMRQEARASKNFGLSDRIRERLASLGIELRDGPHGTSWNVR